MATQPVLVKAFDDVLIIRRSTGTPKEVVSGKADVIIGLNEWSHVVNVKIRFDKSYFQQKQPEKRRQNDRKSKPAAAILCYSPSRWIEIKILIHRT